MICYRLILSLLLAGSVLPFKVLVYSPRFAVSHVKFMGRIADTLVDVGFDVTVLQPITNREIGNGTGVSKAKLITIEQSPDIQHTWPQIWGEFRNPWIHEPHFPTLTQSARHFAQQCNYTILHTEVMEKLKAEKFDVGIAEGYDHCGPAMLHILGCKSRVLASSTVSMESINSQIGLPNIYSYVPVSVAKVSDEATFSKRLSSLITTAGLKYYYHRFRTEMNIVLKYHWSDYPSMEEIIGTSDLVLTNSHPYLDFAHPTLEKIVDVGGIGLDEPRALTEKWQTIVGLRKQTVFVSFGSVAFNTNMPPEWRISILNAMKEFPDVTFIWKHEKENDDFANGAPNVILTTWAPQVDLLFSGRLSLFVSHGGLGSVFEAAFSGAPTLFVPLFADQFRNALMCERKGFAEILSKEKLGDVDVLVATFRKMLTDNKYTNEAQRTSRRLRLHPMDAKTQLVKHIELAAAEGPLDFLDPRGRTLSFVEYFSLDIFALIFSLLIVIIFVLLRIVLWIVRTLNALVSSKQKSE